MCRCSPPTLHHGEGVFNLRLEQVDAHDGGQVLHVHLVDGRVTLHLKQEAARKKQETRFVTNFLRAQFPALPHGLATPHSPADIAEEVVVDPGQQRHLLLQLLPALGVEEEERKRRGRLIKALTGKTLHLADRQTSESSDSVQLRKSWY